VKEILRFLQRESLWPLLVVVVGVIVLLLGLGSYGFWEPQEIQIADRASERAGVSAKAEAGEADKADENETSAPRPSVKARPDTRPPLTEWSVGQGIKHIGSNETGARLPLALLGLLALLATFYLGRRMASPRAGLIAALILVSFPLFVFESRQLMSQIGTVTGSAFVVLGLVGLAWPADRRGQRAAWVHIIDVALIAAGSILGYYSGAALLGLVVPFGAVAMACAGGLISSTHYDRASSRGDAPAEGQTRTRRWAMLGGLAVLILGAVASTIAVVGGEMFGGPALVAVAVLGVVLFALGILPGRAQPRLSGEARWKRWHLAGVGALASAVALAALCIVLVQVFDLKDPIPGERALFGYSLMPGEEPSSALGGTWSLRDNLEATFDALYEQIAFGLFPWIVLAPIALVYLIMAPQSGRHCFGGQVNFAWAALAWVVATILARKVEMVLYSALVPVAVAIAIWLDDLMNAREQADATAESDDDARIRFGMPLRPPLVALFALLAVLVLAKDISTFTDKFLSVHITGAPIQYPSDVVLLKFKLKHWIVGFGVLFGLALACGLLFWTRHKEYRKSPPPLYLLRRYGIHAAVAIALLHALFLAQVWTPQMSRKLSSKHIFSVYEDLHEPGEELAIMGSYGSGPQYYAGSELKNLKSRNDLIDFLGTKTRVFALAPAAELCAIHRAVKGDTEYHVLDDSNVKFLLLSNRLEQGETDRNPLARAIVRQMPEDIKTRLSVDFDGQIELIGMNIPEAVDRGESFEMTLFFKVLKPVGSNWKIFAHFDGGGLRFQGDHEPVNGRCTTAFWQAGDYIVDRFTVTAGGITYAKTVYDLYVGFFRGSHGNWKNMDVNSATREGGARLTVDANNRVLVGRLKVK
jgi:hypothetical protein